MSDDKRSLLASAGAKIAPMRPILNIFAASVIWVAFALFVAFPEIVLSFSFRPVAEEFLFKDHAVFLLILIWVDVMLVLWLTDPGGLPHCLTRPRILAFMAACMLIYIVLGVVMPPRKGDFVSEHAALVAVVCLVVITAFRSVWFYEPKTARSV